MLNKLISLFSTIWGWIVTLSRVPAFLIGRLIELLRRSMRVTIGQILKALAVVVAVLILVVSVLLVFVAVYAETQIPALEKVDEIVFLDQGWGPRRNSAFRQVFYYTGQGTTLKRLRYKWFVHLELPWSTKRFANPDHMRAYGFIVDLGPTQMNPDQLPVGFAKRHDPELGDDLLDITCAACHTGQINAVSKDGRRVAIRIDGGAAMHAFTAMKPGHFGPVLLDSLLMTYLNPFKFNRFARNVLGNDVSDEGKAQLREDLWLVLKAFFRQAWTDTSKHLYPVEEGFGRTDALGRISNTVFAENLDEKNYRQGSAPVSYPPVWDIWKFDWVQYNASVKQPLARNIGEAMGVGAEYLLTDKYGRPLPPASQFSATAAIPNLETIELVLHKLKPPEWPEKYLGAIDWCKAGSGRSLFEKHCQGCHGVQVAPPEEIAWNAPGKVGCTVNDVPCIPKGKPLPEWKMKWLPVEDIGTDPTAAMNFVDVRLDLRKTGISEERIRELLAPVLAEEMDRKRQYLRVSLSKPASYLTREKLEKMRDELKMIERERDALIQQQLDQVDLSSTSIGAGLSFFGQLIRDKYFRDKGISAKRQFVLNGYGTLDLPQVVPGYKPRPLSGIWATPPFLHNGSVPDVYALLSPVDERPSRFYVGRRDFDPVRLGYVAEKLSAGGFWFDTSIRGNHNTGHEFRAGYVPWKEGQPQYGVIGPALTPDERWAIIEYLKVHSDEENVIASERNRNKLMGCPAPARGAQQ